MIPVHVISLRRAEARRQSILEVLGKLKIPFTFVDAIDGMTMTDEEALRLCPERFSLIHKRPLAKTQIATAESHGFALQAVLTSGARFACIMEDDACPGPEAVGFLDEEWLSQLPPFDALKLGSDWANPRDDRALPVAEHAGRRICVPLHPTYSAIAYIVSRPGAAKLLRHGRRQRNTADENLFRCPDWNARIMEVRPSVVIASGATSTIGMDPGMQAPIASVRRIVGWLPRIAWQWGRKLRQYCAFVRGQGVGALRRVTHVPVRAPASNP